MSGRQGKCGEAQKPNSSKIRAASPEPEQLNLSQQENGFEGADRPAVATNFAQAQIVSQATVNATARVLSWLTLLDNLK